MKTAFYSNPIFLEHETGAHPENRNRLLAIHEKIEYEKLMEKLLVCSGRPATIDEIKMLHTEQLILEIETASNNDSKTVYTPDCIVSRETFNAALYAVGSVIEASIEIAERRIENAFCAVRPPGHHAEYNIAMGFCFFNNIALSAEFLTKKMGYKRILIFDFDVHHGNGTQHFFEDRSDIFFVSMHQDPLTCYPGTGFSYERGISSGLGYTLNVPVAPGISDEEYLQVYFSKVEPKLVEFRPDFILISAGFDAHKDDPLASLNISEKTFNLLTNSLKKLAEKFCGGRILSILEGGYNLNALSSCVFDHIKILHSDEI